MDMTQENIVKSVVGIVSGKSPAEEEKNLHVFKNLLNQLHDCFNAAMGGVDKKVQEKLDLMGVADDYDDYDDGEEEEEVMEEGIIQQQQQQETAVQTLMQNPQVLEAITRVIEG
jgi:hypothetical protein